MKLKRFVAPDTTKAMRQIKEIFGDEAVILSSHSVEDGVEVVAAIDYDQSVIQQKLSTQENTPLVPYSAKINATVVNDEMESINRLQQEVQSLRHIVEHQLAGFAWQNVSQRHPIQALMIKRLVTLGLDASVAEVFVDNIEENLTQGEAWDTVIQRFINAIDVYQGDLLDQGGIYAFLGPTGVGKTTTIAKLAARFVLSQGASQLGLVTMDTYRIGAHEQLMIYGKIIGNSVSVAKDAKDLSRVLHKLQDKKLVLIDTAGISPRDLRLVKQVSALDEQNKSINKLLVMSVTSQPQVLDEVIKTYMRVGVKSCILTKLDETINLIGALGEIISHQMNLTYLSDGQRVPEDIIKANRQQLFLKVMESSSLCHHAVADEVVASGLKKGVADYAQD